MTTRDQSRIELELCSDCMLLEETGDATHFDYAQDENDDRLKAAEGGWTALRERGDVFNDVDGEGRTTCECKACGHVDEINEFSCTYEENWRGHMVVADRFCPKCNSDHVVIRDNGEDEFSRVTCDCCGTHLAGSRHRYALFPHEETTKA